VTILCTGCGNKLAELRESGSWETRKRGRVILVRPDGLESITCEECGEVWKPKGNDGHGRLAMPTVRRVV
jgi:ribosomal protein S27E